jgi:hypothetical protein
MQFLRISWKVAMSNAELADEFVGCDFGDERLSKRLLKLANVFEDNPGRTIPSAFVEKAGWAACYRFFDNDSVTPQAIITPHIAATQARIQQCEVALLVQDTTELDLTRPKKQVEGAGMMDCESRRGAFFHPVMAFSGEGVPLGFVSQQTWIREKLNRQNDQEKQNDRRSRPIEEKESYRWLIGLNAAKETALVCPDTTIVAVADSESDIYEYFAHAEKLRADCPNLHILMRAGQNRGTTEESDWKDVVRRTPLIGNKTVHIRAREAKIGNGKSARDRSRSARTVELEVRKAVAEIKRPQNASSELPRTIKMNLVLCEETNPPEGEDPICWLLVTTLPNDTDEQVETITDYYCARWQIEVYFRTLKSGCRIEYRRFENLDRILNCLAVMSVVAWRIMYMCYLGRACPDIDCEALFTPAEWKSVYAVLKKPIPATGCPKLIEFIRAVAQLGGFIDRPKNFPGTQTLWNGLQRCYDLSIAWNSFGPGSKKFLTE